MSPPDEKHNVRADPPDIPVRGGKGAEDERTGLADNFRVQSKIIWLGDNIWDGLTWGEDDAQAFTDAAADFFKDGVAPPLHGDSLAGRDSNDTIIVFKLLLPNEGSFHGQKEAPGW